MVVFVVAELLLAMAIPFVAIRGYHTLLQSRTGTFVEEATRDDPGWSALVNPTVVVGVVEVDRGQVTGVTLLVHNPETRSAGSAILVPGPLELDGVPLGDRAPEEAVAALASAIRLGVARVEVLDNEGWVDVLGSSTYVLESPDPVVDDTGEPLFAVGPVEVDAALAAPFLGRPAAGAVAVSVLPRRHLFWNALLADPPATPVPLAEDLSALSGQASPVVDLPVTELEPVPRLDPEATEALIRDLVAFPTGAVGGDRLRVRVLDRTGEADLERIAAALAANGREMISIGNAVAFDGGRTQVIAPVTMAAEDGPVGAELRELARSVGTDQLIVDNEPVDEDVVTVVIGRDFDLADLATRS
jgi:hypothetical protein